jgi:hypothetical protein
LAKSGEHNMLFDIRGRRKRVIQVVYAALALLMALSLFTVVGPVSFGDLFGTGSTSSSSSSVFDDQVQRLERRLAKNPNDQAALVQLTRARYNAGNAQIERDPATGTLTGIPEEAVQDFNEAGDAWQRYLKTDPKPPNAIAAQLAAQALLYAAATSTAAQFSDNIEGAAGAQAIFAEAKPSLNAYLTLAQYRFFAGDEAGGEEAGRKAEAEAPASQRSAVKQAVVQYRKAGEQLQKEVKASSKFQPGAGGEQALENPVGSLSGGGSGAGAPSP